MTFLCTFGEAIVGLMVMIGALVYLVNQQAGARVMKAAGIVAAVFFIAVPLIVQFLGQLDWPTTAVLVIATSLIAYFVREYRKPRVAPPQRPPGGERKPLMPSSGEES